MRNFFLVILLSLSFNQNVLADRIAIIGGGAAGLLSAWLIENHHQVTLFEAQDHLGGHANTMIVNINGKSVPVETAVDFINLHLYPNLFKLLNYLNIPVTKVPLIATFYETNGHDVLLFPPYHHGTVEWKSLAPRNWKKLIELGVLFSKAQKFIKQNDLTTSLQEFVDRYKFDLHFKTHFFYPLLAARWGVTPTDVTTFSAYNTLIYIIDSYMLFDSWYEVKDGIANYIKALNNSLLKTEVLLNSKVVKIDRKGATYLVETQNGMVREFDHIVFATEPLFIPPLLRMLPEHSPVMDAVAKMRTIHTVIAVHSDKRFMPPNPHDWRAVDIRYDGLNAMMTIYKPWNDPNIFKSWINIDVRPDESTGSPIPSPLYGKFDYYHPYTDKAYFEAQAVTATQQGKNNLWFVGLWTISNDIHESAITSAILLAQRLDPGSERLRIFQ